MPTLGVIELLKIIKEEINSIPIIVISGHATVENAVKAMKYGAINLHTKPINMPDLFSEIEKLSRSIQTRQNINPSTTIITENSEMKHLLALAKKAAPTGAAVIITGESGTGKELIADNLHYFSDRRHKPYIKIDCAAIPEGLIESELFGHEKGAFTDARELKLGKFELVQGGTVFLDEIGDMSLKTQAKMLRILQEKQFTRIGGLKSIKSDFRIIAATNKDPQEMICSGMFREDLYYRLSVINLHLPPLRERKEDILLLSKHFMKKRSFSFLMKSVPPFFAMIGPVMYANLRILSNGP